MAQMNERKRERIELELVILSGPKDAEQLGRMHFGYNELKRQGSDVQQLRYLQTTIREQFAELQVSDPAATTQLQNVLRQWSPGLGSTGVFTVRIPGRLLPPDAPTPTVVNDAEKRAQDQKRDDDERESQFMQMIEHAHKEAEKVREDEEKRREALEAQHITEREEFQRTLHTLREEINKIRAGAAQDKGIESVAQVQQIRALEAQLSALLQKSATDGLRNKDLMAQVEKLSQELDQFKRTAQPSNGARPPAANGDGQSDDESTAQHGHNMAKLAEPLGD